MAVSDGNPRFIDIGVNLTDPVFRGIHHGKRKHDDDFDAILERAKQAGVVSMLITGGSLKESAAALAVAQNHNMYATVGCHPTRSSEFEKFKGGPDKYLAALDDLISNNLHGQGRVVAVGECGLDYDRLHFASVETQKKYFRIQLALAKKHHLPLFLHSRSAHADIVNILREEGFGEDGGKAVGGNGGVAHSFTGTMEEARELIDMGFYISINGCGLKTVENLATVASIPRDRIMLETDSPWCSMTGGHASHKLLDTLPEHLKSIYMPQATKPEKFVPGKPVKGRNEPSAIGGVAWVVNEVQQGSFEDLAAQAWRNTVTLFGLTELGS